MAFGDKTSFFYAVHIIRRIFQKHRPTPINRPPTHLSPSHRPKIYFAYQISLIFENLISIFSIE